MDRAHLLPLALILLAAAAMRFSGIGWGIPHYDASLAAATTARTSFNSDEHNIVELVSRMRPGAGDFRPRHWVWGTFHCYVVAGALGVAEQLGVFRVADWREGLRAGDNATVRRVFVVGRAVSATLGVASVLLVFAIGRHAAGATAGLWAAAVLAASPIHVLHSHYLTTDVALSFWLLLTLLAVMRSQFAIGGLLIGIATAVKLPALLFAPLPLAFAWRSSRWRWQTLLALVVGFLLAEPYAVLASGDWWQWLAGVVFGVAPVAAPARLEIGPLRFYPLQLLLYGLGPVALASVLLGLSRVDRRVLLAIALAVLVLGASWITMTRYLLPLIVFLSVAAGVGLARLLPAPAAVIGALAIAPAVVVSVAQVRLLAEPHTAQQAADWIARTVPEGSEIAQAWDAYPLLDSKRWRATRLVAPYESTTFVAPTADYIVLHNLSLFPLRREMAEDLHERYVEVARFERRPTLLGLKLPEPYAAHDWKYTHPELRVLRRKSPLAQ